MRWHSTNLLARGEADLKDGGGDAVPKQQVWSQWRVPPDVKWKREEFGPLTARWQAKPNVEWLFEFIQRGQRENKNITRELQLQPSNMTSVCFCASD